MLVAFIDTHREVSGAEPVCRVLKSHGLKIATSTYDATKNRAPSTRPVRDAELKTQSSHVPTAHFNVYGGRRHCSSEREARQVLDGRIVRKWHREDHFGIAPPVRTGLLPCGLTERPRW